MTKIEVGAPNLSWSPDARWLVFSARESAAEMYGIWRVSVETGERQRVIPPLAKKLPSIVEWKFGDFNEQPFTGRPGAGFPEEP